MFEVMKRFIIYRKVSGFNPQPMELWQFDKLPMAENALNRLKATCPQYAYSIYDNHTKSFLK